MPSDAFSQLVHQDDLTGLPNRRAILKHLTESVPWTRPEAGPVALILLSLDSIREINARHSHAEGDRALVEFAARLSARFPDPARVGRFHGDLFAVVLADADTDQACASADRIREDLKARPIAASDGKPFDLGLHAGAASFPAEAKDLDSLVEAADRALYHSTKKGRDVTSGANRLDAAILADRDRFEGFPCRRFVGREAEMAGAREVLDALVAKRTRLLFIQGKAGSGKSRLLREIAHEAEKRRVLYLHTVCSEATRTTVGHSLSFITERFFSRHPEHQETLKARLSAPQKHVARTLLPSLASWKVAGPDPGQRNLRLLTLQVLEAALVVMAESLPTLIVLDNAQFADRATLDILRVVARDNKAPLGVVLATKKDLAALDRVQDAILHEFMDWFAGDSRAGKLTVAPLTRPDVAAMIDSILLGSPRPAGFDDRAFELSQGSPAYVEEALRSLILRDRIVRGPQGFTFAGPDPSKSLPESLEDAMTAVLKHLPPEAEEVITNAAVLGTKFDLQVLQEVGGQREAPTLDAVEKARTTRIIRVRDDGNPDQLEFTHDTARDTRYREIPEDKKRDTHRRVAKVSEARGRPVSEVAFHQARAAGLDLDPNDPAMEVVPGAPPLRIPRVAEGKTPLDAEGIRRVHHALRAFSGVLKVGRLYPQWSTTAAQFKTQLLNALGDLLALVSPVTLSIDGSGMSVNGPPLEAGKAADALAETVQLLSDRLIGSLTIQRGLEPREVDALVAGLTEPMKAGQVANDHWDRFLDREGIRNFDLLQRRYVAQEGESMRVLRREVPAERPLAPEEIEILARTLRHLKASSDNLKLYPPGHSAVEEAVQATADGFTELIGRCRFLSIASLDAGLVVNGAPILAGDAGAWLGQELDQRGLKSLTLVTNLRPDEVTALVSILSVPWQDPQAAAQAEAVLNSNEIRHFTFGARTYARVQSGTAADDAPAASEPPAPAAEAEVEPAPPPASSPDEVRDARADVRARAYLRMPAESLLTEAFQREFIPVIEALNFGWTQYLASQLIAHVAGFSMHPKKEIKLQALYLLLQAFRDLTGDSRTLLQGATKMPLQEHFERETDEEVVQVSAEVARAWLDNALAAGRLRDVAEFLMRLTMVQTVQGSTLLGYRSGLMKKLNRIVTPERVRLFLETLKSEKPADRTAASQILGALGATVAPPLIKFVKETAELDPRLAAVAALQSIGGAAQQDLGRELTPEIEPDVAVRILGVLERAGNGPLATPILAAVHHRDERVREAGWELIHRIADKAVAGAILRRLVTGEAGPAQRRAITAAAKMGIADLAGEVKRLLMATEEDEFARACVEYFRSVPSAWAVPALKRVLEMRPRMFGIVKGFSDETRMLAVMAAKVTPSRDVPAFLEAARKDPSPQVRQAAQ